MQKQDSSCLIKEFWALENAVSYCFLSSAVKSRSNRSKTKKLESSEWVIFCRAYKMKTRLVPNFNLNPHRFYNGLVATCIGRCKSRTHLICHCKNLQGLGWNLSGCNSDNRGQRKIEAIRFVWQYFFSSWSANQPPALSMVNSDNRGQAHRKIEEGRRKFEGRRSNSICLAILELKDGKSALVYGRHCRIQSVLRVLLEHNFAR